MSLKGSATLYTTVKSLCMKKSIYYLIYKYGVELFIIWV